MSKQTIEITVDFPDGWEFERFGSPQRGDSYLQSDGSIRQSTSDTSRFNQIILRKKFDAKEWWPKWLKAKWIAMDIREYWHAYIDCEPAPDPIAKCWVNHSNTAALRLFGGFIDFTPPPHITDWKESLIRNPWLEDEEQG